MIVAGEEEQKHFFYLVLLKCVHYALLYVIMYAIVLSVKLLDIATF